MKSRDIVHSMSRDFLCFGVLMCRVIVPFLWVGVSGYMPSVFKGRVCRLCGKHVRWFSLHSKFIFLEVCRVTGRFSRENVNKTNRSGVYSTLVFEVCRVNGFRVATVGGFDCIHLRSGARGGRACSGRPAGRGGGCISIISSGEKLKGKGRGV